MALKNLKVLHKISKNTVFALGLFLAIGTNQSIFANDELEDVEAGVEEALAESEAAKAEASATQKRLHKEKEIAEARKVEAEAAGAKARAKQRDAVAVISELDKKIEEEKAEALNHVRMKKKADMDYDKAVKDIAAKEKMLERTQKEKEALVKEREIAQARLVKKLGELKAISDNLNVAKEDRLVMENNLKKTRAEDKLAEQRLIDTRAKTAAEIKKIRANIAAMKAEIDKTKHNTVAREKRRQKIEQSVEQYEQDEAVVQATMERRKAESQKRSPTSK